MLNFRDAPEFTLSTRPDARSPDWHWQVIRRIDTLSLEVSNTIEWRPFVMADVDDATDALTGVLTARAQNVAATLDLTGSVAGIVRKLADNVYDTVPVGVTNAGDLMSRQLSDSRFPGLVSGVPTGGANGDRKLRTDAPFAYVPYLRTADVWDKDPGNAYAWGSRPTANATHLGLVIRVTDVGTSNGTLFECVTYDGGTTHYWVPLSRYLSLKRAGTASFTVLTDTNETTFHTDTVKGGLMVPNSVAVLRAIGERSGNASANTITMRGKTPAQSAMQAAVANDADAGFHMQAYLYVADNLTAFEHLPATSHGSNFNFSDTGSIASPSVTTTSDWDVTWTAQATASPAGDGARFTQRSIEIFYP